MLTDALHNAPDDAAVCEVGCGTGAVARHIASMTGVGRVVGVDPSNSFLAKARTLSPGTIDFVAGVGSALPLSDASQDLGVMWTLLAHVPEAEQLLTLSEARRVLRPGGRIVVFDNDICAWTFGEVSISDDPPNGPTSHSGQFLLGLLNRWCLRGSHRCLERDLFTLIERGSRDPRLHDRSFAWQWVLDASCQLLNPGVNATHHRSVCSIKAVVGRHKHDQCIFVTNSGTAVVMAIGGLKGRGTSPVDLNGRQGQGTWAGWHTK